MGHATTDRLSAVPLAFGIQAGHKAHKERKGVFVCFVATDQSTAPSAISVAFCAGLMPVTPVMFIPA
jgi:hypothetical protein